MKRVWILIAFLVIAVLLSVTRYFGGNQKPQASTAVSTITPTKAPTGKSPERTALFVPYWSLSGALPEKYDRLIYFGVTPTTDAINTEEIGYLRLDQFVSKVPSGVSSYLTLRMLDNQENFTILESKSSQKRIISQTIALAKKNDFDGIVLDLELKALPFESLLKQINEFVTMFHEEANKNGMQLSITQYGDTFYRVRPFDVAAVAKNSDEVMIMAYDLHKAGGSTPGPNFPLDGHEKYGYDFKKMTEGFLRVVPPEKITVIFGYFGYDWPSDSEGKAVNIGAPFSLLEINKQYLEGCSTCVITRDDLSSETQVTYTSGDNVPHVVWFEDQLSIQKKQEYLKSKGLSSYAYWAHSYF